VLAKLASGDDAGKVLDAYNPPQPEFAALKTKLAEVRKNGGIAAPKVERRQAHHREGRRRQDPAPRHERRARRRAAQAPLDVKGDKDSPLYDDAVRDAVKFSRPKPISTPTAISAQHTVKALNGEKKVAHGPTADPIDTIVVNMERWRWLPRDVGIRTSSSRAGLPPDAVERRQGLLDHQDRGRQAGQGPRRW